MVTARAPAMARVGGPTAGRGARRWSDLLRCSATRRVHRHANGEDEECCMSAAVFLRFLRKRGPERLPPAKRGCGNTGAHALFLRLRLISEASLPVYQRGWGRTSPSFLIVNGGSHAERESPRQSRPASLGQSALPSRGPPCAPGTSSPTALSSQFAPPTWVRPPTTFGGRAAASSHAWIARHQPCVQARLKLIEHESTPWRCQWMKVRMPTPLGHTSTMASIGASKPALHIARNPLPPFNRSTCSRIACRAALCADACRP